ncbi:DUF4396 domain-containing protein [Streptomyces sp. NPDC096046]|uniref:DUF4396 domain-containing protein n=1 Tax=Streptomyces sp. NPDC096046 TaxID=3155542 RepID=UPI003321F06A
MSLGREHGISRFLRDGGDGRGLRAPRAVLPARPECPASFALCKIAGDSGLFATGLTIAGKALYADFALDFAFAWVLGVVFQYFTIVPMRNIGRAKGIWAAVKADTLSIVAFQVGLFLGMWIYQELLFAPGLPKTTATYWMLMQVSMVFGFFTAWPVNAWLVRKGWKEKM